MGTLKQAIDYFTDKGGVQWLNISKNGTMIYTGLSNSQELKPFYENKVIKFLYECKASKILIVVGDELP